MAGGTQNTVTAPPANAELDASFAPVAADFAQLNHLVPRLLTSDVGLIEEISDYIISAGGKRLRPLMVLLAAHSAATDSTRFTGADDAHIRLAAIIELLHTATLLHDDVVDESSLRRGRATANALWGNAPTVLVGDFLYSRAFQLMAGLKNFDIINILSDATNVIAEGEVMQLANVGDPDLTESAYTNVIRSKTAKLFEAATHTAAVLATSNPTHIERLRRFGSEFGIAYQLVDDVLDYTGDTETLGKNVGDDLAEGKMTLPLIHTVRHGSPEQAACVRAAIAARSRDALADVVRAVQSSGAIEYTRRQAFHHAAAANEALKALPESPYRDAFHNLATVALQRVA